MIPILVIISIFLSEVGGILAGHLSGALTADEYIQGARSSFQLLTFNFL